MAADLVPIKQTFVTTPDQARTYFADGIKGISVSQGVIKISFFEQFVNTDNEIPYPPDGSPPVMKARHVANIVLEQQSFFAVLDMLNMVRADLLKVADVPA